MTFPEQQPLAQAPTIVITRTPRISAIKVALGILAMLIASFLGKIDSPFSIAGLAIQSFPNVFLFCLRAAIISALVLGMSMFALIITSVGRRQVRWRHMLAVGLISFTIWCVLLAQQASADLQFSKLLFPGQHATPAATAAATELEFVSFTQLIKDFQTMAWALFAITVIALALHIGMLLTGPRLIIRDVVSSQ